MIWKEVKTWAIKNGYSVNREKIDQNQNKYNYFWEEKYNPNNKGQADSVLNLAIQIYNSITDYKHVAYQEEYKKNKLMNDIRYEI